MSAARKPAPPNTEAREALALAISEHSAHLERVAAIERAKEKLFEKRMEANRAVAQASEAVEKAKANAGKAFVDAALGNPISSEMTPKTAQAALTEAEERLEELQAASTALSRELEAANQAVKYSRMKLDAALKAVLSSSPEVAKLLERFESARCEVGRLRHALSFLSLKSALPWGWDNARATHMQDTSMLSSWQSALAELERDANVSLPK